MTPQNPPADRINFIYNSAVQRRAEAAGARDALALSLLRTIIAVSAAIAAGWVALGVSGIGVSLSYGILGACGVHILVIGMAVLCMAAQLLAQDFAKSKHEEIEERLGALAPGTPAADPGPEIEMRWRRKLGLAASAAWIFGAVAGILFVTSLALDIYIGATLEYFDECQDGSYTLFLPARRPGALVQFESHV